MFVFVFVFVFVCEPYVDSKTPPCVHSKTSPCMPAPRAHVLKHVRVVPVHTVTF